MSESPFPGFPPEAIRFFRALKRNNRREWFQPRKPVYDEQVRKPMLALVSALNAAMMESSPQYVNEPEKAVYRIYRDTRFSPDKTPYKTHIAAIFPRRGFEKHCCAGLYFSVAAEEIEVAGGVYMPGPDQLLAIRRHLAKRPGEFRRLAGEPALTELMGELKGDRLARVPKGFCAEDPAADLVRYKQWLFYTMLEPALATTPALFDQVLKRFRAMVPVCDFLNAPLVAARRTAARESFFV